jgi:hypothetical protein
MGPGASTSIENALEIAFPLEAECWMADADVECALLFFFGGGFRADGMTSRR